MKSRITRLIIVWRSCQVELLFIHIKAAIPSSQNISNVPSPPMYSNEFSNVTIHHKM